MLCHQHLITSIVWTAQHHMTMTEALIKHIFSLDLHQLRVSLRDGPAQAPTSTGSKPEVEVYRATGIQHPYDRKENI